MDQHNKSEENPKLRHVNRKTSSAEELKSGTERIYSTTTTVQLKTFRPRSGILTETDETINQKQLKYRNYEKSKKDQGKDDQDQTTNMTKSKMPVSFIVNSSFIRRCHSTIEKRDVAANSSTTGKTSSSKPSGS